MPEVKISIGGRDFPVSCQEGEEHYLQAAAAMLDTEATALTSQIGQLPEARMLLMSGLMLADKAAGVEDQLKVSAQKIEALEGELESLRNAPPVTQEVAIIPQIVTDSLAEIAAQAEAIATQFEEKVKSDA